MRQIYLDNNSTTIIDPTVAEAMARCMEEGFANPASQHQMGQRARRRLEQIRSEILSLIGANSSGMDADQLIFTSGGTESNNLAVCGLAFSADGSVPEQNRILISGIEHPSVMASGEYLQSRGFVVEKIEVDRNGIVQIDDLIAKLQQPARLVSIMAVNNETGVIQPVAEAAKICHDHNVLIHTDAVQAVGKISVNFKLLGVDALSFSAHKLHGPRGIGGLVLKHGLQPFPGIFGGFQQQGFRPGTEDVCLATGILEALLAFDADSDARHARIAQMRDRMQSKLLSLCEFLVVNGEQSDRVPHTLNVSFRGINRQEFLMAADMNGLAISTGSACASGSSDPSPVLIAMGLESDVIEGSIRISLSAFNTMEEIDIAIEQFAKISSNLQH